MADYVACLDEDRLEEWPDFFLEDGHYGVYPRENVEAGYELGLFTCENRRQILDRVTAHRKANVFPAHWNRHLISSIRILSSSQDEVEASSNYLILQTRQDGETTLFQAGKALDTYSRTGEDLIIKSRKIIYDTSRVKTLFVTPI